MDGSASDVRAPSAVAPFETATGGPALTDLLPKHWTADGAEPEADSDDEDLAHAAPQSLDD
ncbi:MAG: hypothetical protein ACK5JT_00235 [Hyphomicrobiaceae bacterium]